MIIYAVLEHSFFGFSGLDSTSSLSVLKSLRAVAEQGRLTVLCVIHQPRFEIFSTSMCICTIFSSIA